MLFRSRREELSSERARSLSERMARRSQRRPLLLTPYAATALTSPAATIAVRHSRSGLERRLVVGQAVTLVDRRGGIHDGVVEDVAYTESDVVYLLGPERRPTAPGHRAPLLDLDLARRRRAARGEGAVR